MLVIIQINFLMEIKGLFKTELLERGSYLRSECVWCKAFIEGSNRYYIVSLANNSINSVNNSDCLGVFIYCFGTERFESS